MSTAEVPAVMVASEREAEAEALKLGHIWTVLPYDEPERGVLGYVLYREAEGEVGEEHRWFSWPMFGRPLEADDREVSFQEILSFIEEERETLMMCDDPKRLLIGYVSYRKASEGKSEVRRVSLRSIKSAVDEPARTRFMAVRESLQERARERNSRRMLAAAALQSTMNLL